MLAGFCTPDAGDILFDDCVVTALPPHKRNTGMVFQNYALWPHMTVAQNAAFGLTVPGRNPGSAERAERVRKILEITRISELADKKPNQLSGGQQQRVALARALVIEPACLLLDEPLSNLDAKLRLEMRAEIRRIVKEIGVTTVYVTHDQKEALSMADRCAVMNGGRIEQVGRPDALYRAPTNAFVADFVGETNLIPATILTAEADDVRLDTPFGQWRAAAAPPALRASAKALLSIRPEALKLDPENAPSGNCFSGRVTQVSYLGESVQYWLTVDTGLSLKALELNPKRLLEPGPDLVTGHVAPEDIVLLPDREVALLGKRGTANGR